MHVRVDRVVQVECRPENGAYDLPDVGVDKIQGYIAGLSGAHARTRRWDRGRLCGSGSDKGTLSAAIAALLAFGNALPQAVETALAFVHRAIETAPGLGSGHGPLNHWA